jgi:asparagine synthase (glutamine-hydrolysing)
VARAFAGSAALARTGWFDAAALARVAEEHVNGRRDNSRLLWQLVMLDRALVRLGAIG